MTLDEAIEHAEEVAEQNEFETRIYDELNRPGDEEYRNNSCQCAADHRQLAEWLRELKELRAEQNEQYIFIKELMDELKEAKRLLKMAVEDFKEINSDILTCKYCRWYSAETEECTYCPDDVPCENICGWKHEAEVLKLLGEKEGD